MSRPEESKGKQRAARKTAGKRGRSRERSEGTAPVIFVTGTDTGVGKTVLTCLLLAYWRQLGIDALAVKPFCSGGRGDAEALRRLMAHRPVRRIESQKAGEAAKRSVLLTLDEVNPFYFDKPVAPPAAVPAKMLPKLGDVVKFIKNARRRGEALLVEGAGGLLSPLGLDYTLADVIRRLKGAKALVTGRNALGTINHSLLTLHYLETVGVEAAAVVLMGQKHPDTSTRANARLLRERAPGTTVINAPRMNFNPLAVSNLEKSVTFLKKTLAEITDECNVSLLARKGGLIESRLINKTG